MERRNVHTRYLHVMWDVVADFTLYVLFPYLLYRVIAFPDYKDFVQLSLKVCRME